MTSPGQPPASRLEPVLGDVGDGKMKDRAHRGPDGLASIGVAGIAEQHQPCRGRGMSGADDGAEIARVARQFEADPGALTTRLPVAAAPADAGTPR